MQLSRLLLSGGELSKKEITCACPTEAGGRKLNQDGNHNRGVGFPEATTSIADSQTVRALSAIHFSLSSTTRVQSESSCEFVPSRRLLASEEVFLG